jgi:transposase
VREMELARLLAEQISPLLEVMDALNERIHAADHAVSQLGPKDEAVRRLRTFPGVGPVTAAAFVAALDTHERFQKATHVRSFLGLVPREYSSGESKRRGRITKAGNSRARSLLVEVAWSVVRSKAQEAASLKAWALRVAARRGKRIAVVGLARRIAGILYAMWRDGTDYAPQPLRALQLVPVP